MSGEENTSSQSVDALWELWDDLYEFCGSESLSEDGLRAIFERHGVAPNNNDPNIDYYDFFFQKACSNERLTEGILRLLLEYFPYAASGNDEESGNTPLHDIFDNRNVTLGMAQLLIDASPDSLRHENWDGLSGFTPLHYLSNRRNVDEKVAVEILKLLLEKCPESIRHRHAVRGWLPIHLAATNKSPEFCRILVDAYPESERITNNGGVLPFHLACQYGNVATVKYLYQLHPESINMADNYGWYPIHHVIGGTKNNNFYSAPAIEMVQFLLDCDPNVLSLSRVDNDGRMPLHYLCNEKELEVDAALDILGLLLERCPEAARHETNSGSLPIHIAAKSKSPAFCRMLIEAYPGSERMPLSTGALPLHLASISNTVATTEYLYQLYPERIGLTDSRTGGNGAYPIHYAIEGMKNRANPDTAVEMVHFLLDCDPNVTKQRLNGKLPLFRVCYTVFSRELSLGPNASVLDAAMRMLQLLYDAHPEAIEEDGISTFLSEFSAEIQTFINTHRTYARQARDRTFISTPNENGQLPLHRALRDNITLGSIKLLIKGNPAAIQTHDNDGALPLHVAIQHHDSTKVVDYLIGLDPNTLTVVDRERNTALHLACRGAKYEEIALLLQKYRAVSVSKRNAYKKLPIHLLLESDAFVNRQEDVKYTESIFQLLRVYPETVAVIMAEGSK